MTIKELKDELRNFPDDKEVVICMDVTMDGLPYIIVANNIKEIYPNLGGDLVIRGVKNNA